MTHGNKIFCQPRRLLFLMAMVLVGSIFIGCKSSRKVVEETRTEFHYTGRDSARIDGVFMGGNERSSDQDTTSVSTGASGTVEIERDSAGRAIKIFWTRSLSLSSLSNRATEAQKGFFGLNASRHSESSGALDSVNKKKEEVAQEIDTAISLEEIIGLVLFGPVILHLIYVFFADVVWPWIKQQRNP